MGLSFFYGPKIILCTLARICWSKHFHVYLNNSLLFSARQSQSRSFWINTFGSLHISSDTPQKIRTDSVEIYRWSTVVSDSVLIVQRTQPVSSVQADDIRVNAPRSSCEVSVISLRYYSNISVTDRLVKTSA